MSELNLGTNGAFIFFFITDYQLNLSNQGCSFSYLVEECPKRFVGSFWSNRFSRSCSLGENYYRLKEYFREVWVFIDDCLEELHPVFATERWETSQHLVEETAKTPPIHIDSMTCLFDDLRGKILRRTTNRSGSLLIIEYFRQPKIS